jgi:acyl carrier protein
MKKNKLLNIINEICDEKDYKSIKIIDSDNFKYLHLRNDIGFDSFDLAQLTVMIEDEFDVDVFEDGLIETVGEVLEKIK